MFSVLMGLGEERREQGWEGRGLLYPLPLPTIVNVRRRFVVKCSSDDESAWPARQPIHPSIHPSIHQGAFIIVVISPSNPGTSRQARGGHSPPPIIPIHSIRTCPITRTFHHLTMLSHHAVNCNAPSNGHTVAKQLTATASISFHS